MEPNGSALILAVLVGVSISIGRENLKKKEKNFGDPIGQVSYLRHLSLRIAEYMTRRGR